MTAILDQAKKEGRRFSEKTLSKLKEAMDALKELMIEAETAATKSTMKGDIEDMTPEEMKALMQEVIQPVSDRLTKVEEALAAKAKETPAAAGATDDEAGAAAAAAGAAGKSQETGEDAEAMAALKSKVEELEKILKPATKGLTGQDNTDEAAKKSAGASDRDGFGRKIR
jgi:hypothetical protein